MNIYYLINNRTFQPSAFKYLSKADEVGSKMKDDFSIIQDEDDLSLYNGSELIKIYAKLGHKVKKFSSKPDGAQKIMKVIEELEVNEEKGNPPYLINNVEQSTDPIATDDQPPKRKSPVIRSKKIRGVGQLVKQGILHGMGDGEILDLAHAQYPENTTSQKDLSWWKWDMRNKGLIDEFNEPTEIGLAARIDLAA